jgi:N-acetyl-beta-hexosaminidase
MSARLARYVGERGKKAIFWDDILIEDSNIELPENVVVHWWNYRRRQYRMLDKALARGHEVIASPNLYTYLFMPVTPAFRCGPQRTFDLRDIYDRNPADTTVGNPLYLGVEACMWTDFGGMMHTIDRRVFPRLLGLTEQMWSRAERLPFDAFYAKVKATYPMLRQRGIDYGPALREETPADYRWESISVYNPNE